MSEDRDDNLLLRGWRNVREAGPRRLALTALLVLLALLIARFSWDIPWQAIPQALRTQGAEQTDMKTPGTGDAERALYDLRSSLPQTMDVARQPTPPPKRAPSEHFELVTGGL